MLRTHIILYTPFYTQNILCAPSELLGNSSALLLGIVRHSEELHLCLWACRARWLPQTEAGERVLVEGYRAGSPPAPASAACEAH